jgi:hypothetical protein
MTIDGLRKKEYGELERERTAEEEQAGRLLSAILTSTRMHNLTEKALKY